MTPALTIVGLSKHYHNGAKALHGIDMEVGEGEFFAILGPNGAGKSTLINIVAQVVTKSSGHVTVFGLSIDKHPQRTRMLLGYTPQEIALDPFFSVREILQHHSGYYGIADNRAWIDALLERLHLAPYADKNSKALSGGMRRRLTIAKALAHKPRLLILDEPTAGVDVALRHSLWEFVRELHQNGTTVILTTHYIEEAQELAQRVAMLRDGEVVACDRTPALLAAFGSRQFEIDLHEAVPFPVGLATGEMDAGGLRLTGEFTVERQQEFFSWLGTVAGKTADLRIDRPRLEDVFLRLTGKQS
ncbi:MAG: ABC transporter ATP-binding protein [Magnetococcales bacterium]|nr:ABC transporter ATP-binding protein [Magnetococcales bacterium]MBF0322186.1 ABC transporter ATP-binding protein [Magnetococcales bacterium]